MSAAIVQVHGVGVTIGPAQILNGVDLDVCPGEFVALVGPNGAGKSTLLSVIAGDRAATSGSVTVGGSPVSSYRPLKLARLRSVLPQTSKTMFSFDAASVVAMGRHPCTDPQNDRAVIRESLERVGAVHLANRSFPTLSGGEQTLVGLARVLAQQTPIVLLDEPTAALDVAHQELVCAIGSELASQGRAVVVVLHELNLAARHSDRVVVLHGGRVVVDAPPADALCADRLSRVYGHPIAVMDHPIHAGRRLVLPTTTSPAVSPAVSRMPDPRSHQSP
jgi:iron complex transport system ATP-binding protein